MNKTLPYLIQYCELSAEWQRRGIDIDNATVSQANQIRNLQKKASEQSGLSFNEIALIAMCRSHNIFRKINTYARRLIDF